MSIEKRLFTTKHCFIISLILGCPNGFQFCSHPCFWARGQGHCAAALFESETDLFRGITNTYFNPLRWCLK